MYVRRCPQYLLSNSVYKTHLHIDIYVRARVFWERQRYMRLKSDAVVIRLHIGQSLDSRQRSQHSRQHVCQHWVETVGSVYGSRQILHVSAGLDGSGWDSNDGCFARGTEGPGASISMGVSDSLLELIDIDADKMSTSVNCARPNTSSSSPSTSISSSTST